MTISKAIELEETGLSIFTRLLLQSVAHPRDDFINGVAEIAGYRRWVDLQLLEDALQSDFSSRDTVTTDEVSSQHEHLHSNLMAYVSSTDDECSQHANRLWNKLNAAVPNLMNYEGSIKGTLSWPRGGKQPMDACKVFLLKIILGVSEQDDSDTYWNDAIVETPSEVPSQIFNSDLYTEQHLKKGFEVILALVVSIEKNGGIHVLDTNDLVMKSTKKMTMVPWLKNRGWEEVYTCFDLVVMIHETEENEQPRVIFVCRPWCWMLFSGDKSTDDQYKSQAKRTKTGHVLQAIIKMIKEGNTYDPSISVTTHQSFWNNLLTSFAMRVYLLHNLHAFPIHANVFAKNLLCKRNLIDPDNHSMSASKNGVNRRQQNAAAHGTASHNKDRHKSQHCQNHLSLSGHDGVDDLSDRIKRVHNRMTVYGEATTQRVGDRIHKTDQERNLKTLFDDWVNEKSETGKKIRNLMNQEQTQHSEDLSEEQNQKYSKLKEQFQKDEDNF